MNYTIMIPTYMRPDYLQRILDYYDKFGKHFKIIVADSSHKDVKKINRKIVSSCSNLEINYLDHYSPELNPHHKFADMVTHVTETYCIFCPDDDFIIPHGIEESVSFLEKNLDFTCAHGKYISFNYKQKNKFRWGPINLVDSNISPDPKERLLAHFSHYYQTLFAVHRTEFFQMIYRELLRSKVDPILFGELLPDMLTVIHGKMKRLDVLYAAREEKSTLGRDWMTLQKARELEKFDDEYGKFRDCLALHLSKNSQLDIEATKIIVDEGMKLYMGMSSTAKNKKMKYKLGNTLKDCLDCLQLPESLDDNIRGLYRRLFLHIDDPTSKYYEDFNTIKNHVLRYAEKEKMHLVLHDYLFNN